MKALKLDKWRKVALRRALQKRYEGRMAAANAWAGQMLQAAALRRIRMEWGS